MISNRVKGRQKELKCKDELERQGWLVAVTDMPQRYKKQQDFFNVFDIIAVRKQRIAEKLFIQVTSGSTRGRLKKLKEFKGKWLESKDTVQLWVWINYKGFKIYEV